ncbi:MAG: hypothetical protein WC829_02745 [Hyphomicrobium sp.]
MTRRNNSLTHSESSRLYRWLDGSRVWASTATAKKCAELATTELKFTVTVANVLSVKKALNIVKPAPVKAAGECRCRDLAAALFAYIGSDPEVVCDRQTLLAALYDIAGKRQPAPKPAAQEPLAFPPRNVSAECAG